MKIILMADIVGSSKRKGKALMASFKEAVDWVNDQNPKIILSPLTITLGDEFQGVVTNPHAALRVIFDLEDYIMDMKNPFKLRFVIHEGDIDTRLNKDRAYEMLGSGLTEARETLTAMKSSKRRYLVSLRDKGMTEKLNLLFVIRQGILDRWTPAQRKVASAFLSLGDYRKVAERLKKDPSAVWRRRKTLMLEEYHSVNKVMLKMVGI